MVLVLAAYPVVPVTVRSILLACTCGYHMQIRISLLWLYIAYDIIESSGAFQHGLFVKPITAHVNDSNRRLAEIHSFW